MRNPEATSIHNQIMAHCSNKLTPSIENFEMSRWQFLRLLNLFVDEDWQNHETYNSFIRGFGSQFEEFNNEESVKFIKSLVKVGLNQQDILEAVTEKVLSGESPAKGARQQALLVDLMQTAIDANATETESFQKLISEDHLSLENLNHTMRNHKLEDSMDLLGGIIARTDLKEDSRLKEIGSGVLNSINESMEKLRFPPYGYLAKRKMATFDYLFNEHPNRAELVGADWSYTQHKNFTEGVPVVDESKR